MSSPELEPLLARIQSLEEQIVSIQIGLKNLTRDFVALKREAFRLVEASKAKEEKAPK